MTAIVMNTTTGAVTEYGAAFNFTAIARTLAADGAKLYELGGLTDASAAIAATWRGPMLGGLEVRRPEQVYAAVRGPADSAGKVRVLAGGKTVARGTEWLYDLTVQASGISRCTPPGKGIRENFLAYGYQNVAGAPFVITLFQVDETTSQQRKAH
ncbi:MAG TPA: hypothetical protein VIL30_23620 [Ramlibacter sp.]